MKFVAKMAVVTFAMALTVGACKKKEASAAGSLDGKTFAVQLTKPGESSNDKLVFAQGTFDSVECQKYGFAKASYEMKTEGGAMTFRSEAKSAKEGLMKWAGRVEGDRVSGTADWIKEGQAPIHYTFAGSLAK
jgi:hypothetical protein